MSLKINAHQERRCSLKRNAIFKQHALSSHKLKLFDKMALPLISTVKTKNLPRGAPLNGLLFQKIDEPISLSFLIVICCHYGNPQSAPGPGWFMLARASNPLTMEQLHELYICIALQDKGVGGHSTEEGPVVCLMTVLAINTSIVYPVLIQSLTVKCNRSATPLLVSHAPCTL